MEDAQDAEEAHVEHARDAEQWNTLKMKKSKQLSSISIAMAVQVIWFKSAGTTTVVASFGFITTRRFPAHPAFQLTLRKSAVVFVKCAGTVKSELVKASLKAVTSTTCPRRENRVLLSA